MKKNQKNEKLAKIDDNFLQLLECWEKKDSDHGKSFLNHICETTDLDDLKDLFLTDIRSALGIFQQFIRAELDFSSKDTPAYKFFLRIVKYISSYHLGTVEHQHEFIDAFSHYCPDIFPILFPKHRDKYLNEFKVEIINGPKDDDTIH